VASAPKCESHKGLAPQHSISPSKYRKVIFEKICRIFSSRALKVYQVMIIKQLFDLQPHSSKEKKNGKGASIVQNSKSQYSIPRDLGIGYCARPSFGMRFILSPDPQAA
jgi:hypothetical protein